MAYETVFMAGVKLASMLIGKIGRYEIDYRNYLVEDGADYSDLSINDLLTECANRSIDTTIYAEEIKTLIDDGLSYNEANHSFLSSLLINNDNQKEEGCLGKLYIGDGINKITYADIEKFIEILIRNDYFQHYPLVDIELNESNEPGESKEPIESKEPSINRKITFRWES